MSGPLSKIRDWSEAGAKCGVLPQGPPTPSCRTVLVPSNGAFFFTGRGLRNAHPSLSPGHCPGLLLSASSLPPRHAHHSPAQRHTQAGGLRFRAIKIAFPSGIPPQEPSPMPSNWTSCSHDPKWGLMPTVCQACPYGYKCAHFTPGRPHWKGGGTQLHVGIADAPRP